MSHDSHLPDPDLHSLDQQLRDARPVPTEDELGRVHRRALGARSAPTGLGVRSARLAMVSLVSGLVFIGGGGAALAVSGSSGSGSAGAAQYQQFTPSSNVAPESDQGTNTNPTSTTDEPTTPDQNGVEPEQDSNTPGAGTGNGADPAQQVRQASSGGSDSKLPFTGLAAIPLLGLGALLLASGLVLRRRASSGLRS